MGNNKSGFTLVEILTAITIIAVLVAITVPVVTLVKNHSKLVGCTSNLRQIDSVLSMYTADNAGAYPPDPGLNSAADEPFWFQRLYRYAGRNKGLFWCPAANSNTPLLAGDLTTPYPASYSYNILLTTSPTPAQYSATRVAVTDGTTNFAFTMNDGSVSYQLPIRHGNGWNVLYVDGHVRLRTSGNLAPDRGYHWEATPP
jgi:prepilin-type N-terminal cleavage/methylation domain-containing protein/prepilin-type processing-associated H-X9-DG protein